MNTALATLLLALSTYQMPDTAAALEQAQDLVLEHYDYLEITGRFNPHVIGMNGRACRGVSRQDCMQGDWSCLDVGCPWDHLERRAALISKLEQLAPLAANSEWLFRHRVGFAIKNDELERADTIAHACPDGEWWCQTLRGLTAHLLRPGDGLAHFDSAFAIVSSEDSAGPGGVNALCQWSDIRAVVAVEMLDEAPRWSCPESETLYERFWWLADPLWTREGNERLAEHLARLVMIRMDQDIQELLRANALEGRYGSELWESHASFEHMLREGFPNSNTDPCWDPVGGDRAYGCPGTRVSYVHGGYSFAPDRGRMGQPLRSTAEDWVVEWHNGGCQSPWKTGDCGRRGMPREWPSNQELIGHDGCQSPWRLEDCGAERMITPERWHNLDHQTVVLRRGTEFLLVSAARVPEEVGPAQGLEAALALGRPADLGVQVVPGSIDEERIFRTRAEVGPAEYLASIEVVGEMEIARARFGAPAPPLTEGFGVSVPALVHPLFEAGELTVAEALFPSTEVSSDRYVGLYFEIYGLEEDEEVSYSLTSTRLDPSVLHRVVEFLGLTSGASPLDVTWGDPGIEGEAVTRRFFNLDLSNLGEGEYRLTLEVRREDGQTAVATREIRVR